MVKSVAQFKAGLDLHGLRPVAGQCFAVAMPESEAQDHGIWIPDSAMRRNAPGFVVEIVAENATDTTLRGTVTRKTAMAQWAGQRFHWCELDLIRYNLSLEHFLAVYFEGEWLPLLSDSAQNRVQTMGASVPRCRFCKSHGEGNMILSAGICPQCGKNAAGRRPEKYRYTDPQTGKPIVLDQPLTMNEEEREMYSGIRVPRIARGMKISYPGQGKK